MITVLIFLIIYISFLSPVGFGFYNIHSNVKLRCQLRKKKNIFNVLYVYILHAIILKCLMIASCKGQNMSDYIIL